MLEKVKGKLIVSCQATAEEPLHSSFIMGRMAIAAKQGGACAIRTSSVEDVNEISRVVDLPIIGLIKRKYEDSEIFITATEREVKELLTTSCEVIALDATFRKRPNDEKIEDLVKLIHDGGRLAMADCSTVEECLEAEKIGFDIVSTTMFGYTSYSKDIDGPDFEAIKEIVESVKVPVIAEGKINTPEDLKKVYEYCGVYSAVVGSAITRPQEITKRFVNVLNN